MPVRPHPLSIDSLHHRWCVALACYRAFGQRVFDPIEILLAQGDVGSADVLFEASNAACAGDGNHVLMATEEPCQGKLSWRTVLFFRDFPQAVGDRKVFRELFSLETGIAAPPVVGREVADGAKPAGEK